MKNLCSPEIERWRIPHPAGEIPDALRAFCGAFMIPYKRKAGGLYEVAKPTMLRVIASRGEGQDQFDDWDHVSVSLPDHCPSWSQMSFIKDLFFEPHEVAMQLHPVSEYVNNHPYCLHLWRPLRAAIPLPPSILVGLPELNVA